MLMDKSPGRKYCIAAVNVLLVHVGVSFVQVPLWSRVRVVE